VPFTRHEDHVLKSNKQNNKKSQWKTGNTEI